MASDFVRSGEGIATTLAVLPQSRMIGSVLGLGVVAVSLLLWLLIALAAFGLYKVLT